MTVRTFAAALDISRRKALMRNQRTITAGVVTRFLADQRSCRVLFHSSKVALDNLSVSTDGLDLSQYQRNPVVLAYHEADRPVGTMDEIIRIGDELHGRVIFAPLGASEHADEMVALVKVGIVRGASIGFSPLEMRPPDRNGIARVTRALLHEVSMVTIPSLHDALVTERAHATRSATVALKTVLAEQDVYEFNQEEARRKAARATVRNFYVAYGPGFEREHAERLQRVRMAAAKRRELQRRGLV